MSDLSEKHCVPCVSGTKPLDPATILELARDLRAGWQVVEMHHLEKDYRFPDFKKALQFTVSVGELAEEQGHHPDFFLGWGQVRLTLWTHSAGGLTESDFVMAAKIDRLNQA